MSNLFKNLAEKKIIVFLVLALLILISLSFGVGYLLGHEANPAPIIIQKKSN